MASFHKRSVVNATDTAADLLPVHGDRVSLTIQAGDQPIWYLLCETDDDTCTAANGTYLAARETHGWSGGGVPSNRISVLRATSTSTTAKAQYGRG